MTPLALRSNFMRMGSPRVGAKNFLPLPGALGRIIRPLALVSVAAAGCDDSSSKPIHPDKPLPFPDSGLQGFSDANFMGDGAMDALVLAPDSFVQTDARPGVDAHGDQGGFCVSPTCDHGWLNQAVTPFQCTQFLERDLPADIPPARPQGLSVVDVNGDGQTDLYVLNQGAPNQFYVNQGGRFTEQSAHFGLNLDGASRFALWVDYDADGDNDLFLGGDNGTHLYRNEDGLFRDFGARQGFANDQVGTAAAWLGGGLLLGTVDGLRYYPFLEDLFSDQTEARGFFDPGEAHSLLVRDFNGDGQNDVLVGNISSKSRVFSANADGTYRSAEDEWGLADLNSVTSAQAVGSWPGASSAYFLTQYYGPNQLIIQQSPGAPLVDHAREYGLRVSATATGAAFTPWVGSNYPAVFVGHWEEPSSLMIPVQNEAGQVAYQDIALALGLAATKVLTATWLDFDQDGDQDLILVLQNGGLKLFENQTYGMEECP